MDQTGYAPSSSIGGGNEPSHPTRPMPPTSNWSESPSKLTPITGRVSRAKKGVPVHTCDVCKPPKTFTRAEHLRRHQLSHQNPAYICLHTGCDRAFHRADLLARHQQKHKQEGSMAPVSDAPSNAASPSVALSRDSHASGGPYSSPSTIVGPKGRPSGRHGVSGSLWPLFIVTQGLASTPQPFADDLPELITLDPWVSSDSTDLSSTGLETIETRNRPRPGDEWTIIKRGSPSIQDQLVPGTVGNDLLLGPYEPAIEEDFVRPKPPSSPKILPELEPYRYPALTSPHRSFSGHKPYESRAMVTVPGVISQLPARVEDSDVKRDLDSLDDGEENDNEKTRYSPATFSSTGGSQSPYTTSTLDGIQSPRTLTQGRKDVIIKHILVWFKTWLESKLRVLAHQYGGDGESASGSAQVGAQLRGADRLRKRQRDAGRAGDDNDGSDDHMSDNDKGDDGTGSKRHRVEAESPKQFACPFLKHDRKKYEKWRCCAWSGWETVHRVKEHLYRKHRLPKFRCKRCCQVFKSETQLSDHQREMVACPVRAEEPQDGLNDSQLELLRSRKRGTGQKVLSEEEKWVRVYRIIFPDDDVVPSPYHDTTYGSPECPTQDGGGDLLRDLGDYTGREFPRLMRPRLQDMLDRVIDNGLDSDEVVNLAQVVFQQILQAFKSTKSVGDDAEEEAPVLTIATGEAGALEPTPQRQAFPNDGLTEAQPPRLDFFDPTVSQRDLYNVFQDTVVDSLGSFEYSFDGIFPPVFESDSGYVSRGPSFEKDFSFGDGSQEG